VSSGETYGESDKESVGESDVDSGAGQIVSLLDSLAGAEFDRESDEESGGESD
jgi:hypothetical protein